MITALIIIVCMSTLLLIGFSLCVAAGKDKPMR